MRAYLPDVNVLIALTWPTHVHHAQARRWFDRKARSGWATCPITQLGFVRISSNAKIIRDAVSPREAVAMLRRLVGQPGHVFWSDEPQIELAGPFASLSLVGHRQVTDAYLLSLVQHRKGRLATFDRGLPELVAKREERERWVEVIE